MVYLINLPVSIRGLIVRNGDDSYTILINARLSTEMQCAAYDHEIEHINRRDYDHFYSIHDLEWIRHAG